MREKVCPPFTLTSFVYYIRTFWFKETVFLTNSFLANVLSLAPTLSLSLFSPPFSMKRKRNLIQLHLASYFRWLKKKSDMSENEGQDSDLSWRSSLSLSLSLRTCKRRRKEREEGKGDKTKMFLGLPETEGRNGWKVIKGEKGSFIRSTWFRDVQFFRRKKGDKCERERRERRESEERDLEIASWDSK